MPISPISPPLIPADQSFAGITGQAAKNQATLTDIQRQKIANAISGVQLQYAPQMAQQDLLQKQIASQYMPGQEQAQIQANLGTAASGFGSAAASQATAAQIRGVTPYAIKQEQYGVVTDPLIRQAVQSAYAKRENLYGQPNQQGPAPTGQPPTAAGAPSQQPSSLYGPGAVGNALQALGQKVYSGNASPQEMQQYQLLQQTYANQVAQGSNTLLDRNNEANNLAMKGQMLSILSQRAKADYKAARYKGAQWGRFANNKNYRLLDPGYDFGPEQDLQKTLSQMQSINAEGGGNLQGGGGHLTNMFLQQGQNMTPSGDMPLNIFNKNMDSLNTLGGRMREPQLYYLKASQSYMPNQVPAMDQGFLKYNHDYPIWDNKGNPQPQNIGHLNEYLTPQAVNSFKSGQDYSSPTAPSSMVSMISPEGKKGRVSASERQKLLQMNKGWKDAK